MKSYLSGRYDYEFILWNLVPVRLKWKSPSESILFSVHAFWPWLHIRVSLEFKTNTHTPLSPAQFQALSTKSESPELELWDPDIFEVPQEMGAFHL